VLGYEGADCGVVVRNSARRNATGGAPPARGDLFAPPGLYSASLPTVALAGALAVLLAARRYVHAMRTGAVSRRQFDRELRESFERQELAAAAAAAAAATAAAEAEAKLRNRVLPPQVF
jgi:hypothetical protein